MGETTKVTEKGQTTIPRDLREKYGIEPGDSVEWVETEDGVMLTKAVDGGGRGMLVPDNTDENTREEIAQELTQRIHARRTKETPDT
ncbi:MULTISPECIES: AbrB/MazE/SpoVT family DNA-binding domain-containing protein [Haloarcula]|uniref:AbrB/MazE/SpoVT family DNA-binding domain-containing protein n=1 Tax=Haloarcula TaxID=2237 RepID=UPI000F8F546B|nr:MULTISPECIES: AbrB/MazE/SpoVT family DNA-binding domain-containing protein [Haloarcula]NHX41487.1 AbrB/MazE/SpoVT family DNA-binding domain-containing protein [Haloarcula sp. R1-2]